MHLEQSVSSAQSDQEAAARFRSDVISGLRRMPKSLPSKYFYDDAGSALFDRICELDAYYPTRAETEIMERHAEEMASILGPQCLLVEYGSGSSVKTEILLDHLPSPIAYVPIDISDRYLDISVARLRRRFPDLPILPVAADYTLRFDLPEVPAQPRRTIVYFPGSTIGNFDPQPAADFLADIARVCGPDGGLLIGVDMKKDRATLERAYNDPEGVTAAFNLNLLARINRELDGEFRLDRFAHRAFYNENEGRIEMHLVSLVDQRIRIGPEEIDFVEGETVRTEYSHKYSVAEFEDLAQTAGLGLARTWTDSANRFSVHYLAPLPSPSE